MNFFFISKNKIVSCEYLGTRYNRIYLRTSDGRNWSVHRSLEGKQFFTSYERAEKYLEAHSRLRRVDKQLNYEKFSRQKTPAIFDKYPDSSKERKHGEESSAANSRPEYGYTRIDGSPYAKPTPRMGYHYRNKSNKGKK